MQIHVCHVSQFSGACFDVKTDFSWSVDIFITKSNLYNGNTTGKTPFLYHYNDVIMNTTASQITSIMVVYSTVYSGADKKNIKAPRHWPLCRGTVTDEFPAQRRVTRKMFPFWWRHHFERAPGLSPCLRMTGNKKELCFMDLTVTDCKFHDNYKSKIENEMRCNNSAMPLLKPPLKLRQTCVKTPNTVETLYNTVNFCWNTHKRHSIARPKGRGMGCLLWVQRATYCVDLSKLSSIKYLL